MKIMVINGPNLNLLGEREPKIYGPESLEDISRSTNEKVGSEIHVDWYQSNLEGEIINWIQACLKNNYDGLVINPGGYGHTSVAIHDALKMLKIPKIEIHLSQVFSREEFRHKMLTASAVDKVLTGLGKESYFWAIKIIAHN